MPSDNCTLVTLEVTAGPPVDFSFKNLQSLGCAPCGRPRAVRLRKMPCTGCSGRYVTRSVWLNNNCLRSLCGVAGFVSGVVEQPSCLGWLDLSHNFITDVHQDILCFPQLRILYLHGNLISNMCTLAKLKNLRCLRTLTLHGNPIEAVRGYRLQIINMLPQVRTLDFAPVIRRERRAPVPGGRRCVYCTSTKPCCPPPCTALSNPCAPCVPHVVPQPRTCCDPC